MIVELVGARIVCDRNERTIKVSYHAAHVAIVDVMHCHIADAKAMTDPTHMKTRTIFTQSIASDDDCLV